MKVVGKEILNSLIIVRENGMCLVRNVLNTQDMELIQ